VGKIAMEEIVNILKLAIDVLRLWWYRSTKLMRLPLALAGLVRYFPLPGDNRIMFFHCPLVVMKTRNTGGLIYVRSHSRYEQIYGCSHPV
jgi:hypothetical protein